MAAAWGHAALPVRVVEWWKSGNSELGNGNWKFVYEARRCEALGEMVVKPFCEPSELPMGLGGSLKFRV